MADRRLCAPGPGEPSAIEASSVAGVREADAVRDATAPGRAQDRQLERHLVILMAARLALAIAGLVIGLGLDALGDNVTITQWHGFYGTVALAFVAAVVYRGAVGRVRRPERFAALNIVTDIGLVSALVLFSGGKESVFTFLYLVVAVYAALLFQRGGALACAVLAGLGYGCVLLAVQQGWVEGTAGAGIAPEVLLTAWVVHALALVLVAALSSFLAEELERTGKDLVQLRTLHRRTVESLRSGLLTTDAHGRVTSFNPEAERITGLHAEQAVGVGLDDVLAGVSRALPETEAAGGMRTRMPFRNRRGEVLHLGVGAYALREEDGGSDGRVVIFQDVTAVVRMERELRRSERLAAAGQLSASIAHEIRNPLAAISGSIQVLQARIGPGEGESGRLMEIVLREVDRLDHLITDFLVFARPGPLQLGAVSVGEVVSEVVEMFESAGHEGVALELDLAAELVVRADPGQLRQLLWNLVLNAAQAMPEGGRLRIEGRTCAAQEDDSEGRMDEERKPHWAEIAVMDQGTGIPAEALEHIFDPFFTTKREGSGLGLPTVHRIVEDHGGALRVERNPSGWSTRIRVRLPGAEATE
jgi:two-component system sensor histidine kinase PilS (NtrC family)